MPTSTQSVNTFLPRRYVPTQEKTNHAPSKELSKNVECDLKQVHEIPSKLDTKFNQIGKTAQLRNRIITFLLILLGVGGIAAVVTPIVIKFTSNNKTTTVTTTTATTATTTTATSTTSTSATTTTSTTSMTTITFIPTGIYALTIPTCATWNQTGITVAGNKNGTYGSDLGSLWNPVSIFVDNNYTLYVTDRDNHRVMKYYQNSTVGTVVTGNLTAGNSATQLNSPKGVAVNQYGSVVVADSSNYRIQQFASGFMNGTTIASNSSMNLLGQVRDLHIDVNNNIYVTDSDNSKVLKYYPYNGIGVVLAPTNGTGSGANQLLAPFGNFMDGNGSLYIADAGNHRVQMWQPGATTGITVAGITGSPGSNSFTLNSPYSIIVDNNWYVYIADGGNSRIMRWTTNYTAGGTCIVGCTGVVGSGTNQLHTPRDLKFDAAGNLYVTDQGNHRIQKFLIQLSNGSCTMSG